MGWNRFELDKHAQEIVLAARQRDRTARQTGTDSKFSSLNQAHKMRTTCAFGLERFWGEHLRLKGSANESDRIKADFIADTWKALTLKILPTAGIHLPSEVLPNDRDEDTIRAVSAKIWKLDNYDRVVALAVLTNLCDAIVWWTQRLKTSREG